MAPLTAPGAEAPVPESRPFHEPVLVDEVMDLLLRGGEGWYLDGTLGGGGHARALLERCAGCRVLGADRDPEALERARTVLEPYGDRVRLLRARLDRVLERADVGPRSLAGALLDLGVSSHQLDADERGFTFRRGVPLEMRMGQGEEGRPSAAELLGGASVEELWPGRSSGAGTTARSAPATTWWRPSPPSSTGRPRPGRRRGSSRPCGSR